MKDLLNALKRIAADEGSLMLDTHESMPMIAGAAGSISDPYGSPLAPWAGKSSSSLSLQQSDPQLASLSISDSVTGPGPAPPADTDAITPARPKGRTYVWVLAAAVAMGITVVMVLSTQSNPTAVTPSPTAAPASTGAPAPALTNATPKLTSSPAAVPSLRTVRVESDPSGASVSENGTELCMSTPCELVWKGDAATAEHKLSISKRGYRTARIAVTAKDEKVSSKLDPIPINTGRSSPPQGGTKSNDGKPTSKPNPYGD
jgi:serine/threonine-protein kinase